MNPILELLIGQAPQIIGLIGGHLGKSNPGAPPPTSEEVIQAFRELFTSSDARDEFLKASLKSEIAGQGPQSK